VQILDLTPVHYNVADHLTPEHDPGIRRASQLASHLVAVDESDHILSGWGLRHQAQGRQK